MNKKIQITKEIKVERTCLTVIKVLRKNRNVSISVFTASGEEHFKSSKRYAVIEFIL